MSRYVVEAESISLDYPVHQGTLSSFKSVVNGGLKSLRMKNKRALSDVDLKVEKGQVVGIIGSNGAGKSTLLRTIGGIYNPDEGVLRTRGQIVLLATFGIGFAPDMSGRENIRLSAGFLGLSDLEIKNRVEEIIDFSELGDVIDSPLRTYSSGMRSRLGFSIACHVDPEILLLDEVFTVGDYRFRMKSTEKIKELIDGDCTVLMVSHSLDLISQMCDEAIVMEKGAIIFTGPPDDAIRFYQSSDG